MTAVDIAAGVVIAMLVSVALSFIAIACIGAARIAIHGDEAGMCAPSRRANITANHQTPAERRITLLGLIDAVPLDQLQLQQQQQPVGDYAVPRPDDVDAIKAGSLTYDLASLTAPAVPELPPAVEEQGIAVDWPTRPAQVVVPVTLRQR